MRKTIKKVKLNGGGLVVSFSEYFNEDDYTNEVDGWKCSQFAHKDMLIALDKLKPHVACISEFPEASDVELENIDTIYESMDNLVITGFTTGGSDESEGACILAQRILKTGKVLNITTPFMQYENDEYPFAGELNLAIQACVYETLQYMEKGKFGFKQQSIDFDGPTDADIAEAENIGTTVGDVVEKKKRKRKQPTTAIIAAGA